MKKKYKIEASAEEFVKKYSPHLTGKRKAELKSMLSEFALSQVKEEELLNELTMPISVNKEHLIVTDEFTYTEFDNKMVIVRGIERDGEEIMAIEFQRPVESDDTIQELHKDAISKVKILNDKVATVLPITRTALEALIATGIAECRRVDFEKSNTEDEENEWSSLSSKPAE